MSVQQARDAGRRQARPSVRFALTAPRQELSRRIDARVDAMVGAGLVEEVQTLMERRLDRTLSPLRSLGYKEMVAYLDGQVSRDEAIAEMKQNTRRFAKRQLTWFRADRELTWIDVGGRNTEEVAEDILERLPS